MLGNWLNLYNVFESWDTLPHIHGPGALALIWRGLGRRSVLASAGVATMLHVALEVQEYLGDAVSGTHNVQGAGDTVHDLASGLIGCWAYIGGWELIHRWRGIKRLPDIP
jgi:hypothetical protein